MLSLRVTYLTGRAHAARFEDGDERSRAEWPPHPSRLFNALVAAWGEGGEDPAQRDFLMWLERQPPPAMACSGSSEGRRPLVTFVPVNDSNEQEQLKGAKGNQRLVVFQPISETVGVRRDRKPRRFPSAAPDDPVVWFVWAEDPDPAHLPALRDLLRHVVSVGNSSSLVDVTLSDRPPEGGCNWKPDPSGSTRLRVPTPGRLDYLRDRYRRFVAHPIKQNRPDAGATALYRRAPTPDPVAGEAPASELGEMFIFVREEGPRLPITSALQIARAVRGALIANFDGRPMPEAISGHAPGSTPERPVRSERPHVALVALPDVGHRRARGHLMGIAALVPRAIDQGERDICLDALAALAGVPLRMGRAGEWRISPVPLHRLPLGLSARTWGGPAETWATATPVVLDRFPDDPEGEEARGIVSLACRRIGLPEPVDVTLLGNSPILGVPPACRFPAMPARGGKPTRYHTHAIIAFDRPVLGPVIVGAGRYYGYGLCRPLE